MIHILLVLTLVLAGIMVPSGASAGEKENLESATLLISPGKTVYTGESISPRVTVLMDGNQLTKDRDYTVTYLLSGKKVYSMKEVGTYTVRISGKGAYTGTLERKFTIVPVNLEDAKIVLSDKISSADIDPATGGIYEDRLYDFVSVIQGSEDVTKWCSLYSEAAGSVVEITALIKTGDGKNIINSQLTAHYDIKKSLDDYEISYIPAVYYTGYAVQPEVTVVNKSGYITLKKGKDYTVAYEDNVEVSRRAKITVTGIGEYTGSIVTYFRIQAPSINNCMFTYVNGRKYAPYSGNDIRVQLNVRDTSYRMLKEGQDYTISYVDEKGNVLDAMREAGKYTVVVTGCGNYSETAELDFEIRGEDIGKYTVSLRQTLVKADGGLKAPLVTSVRLGSSGVLSSADYTVHYENSVGKEVEELSAPGTYRVVVSGRNGYCGTAYAEFRIIGKDQNLKVDETSYKAYKNSKNIQIKAEADGDGDGFTYTSSDPKVASVDKNGVIDIHKIGLAVITVKTKGNILSEPASEKIYVKVYPYKTVMGEKPWTDGEKKSFRVRWNTQQDVTYYEVRYATTSTFKSGTYKTKRVNASYKNYATQSTKISGLSSGRKYYVKVRAVKVAENDAGAEIKYYGTWSSWKSVKTK